MLQTFHRKEAVLKITGYKHAQFHEALSNGTFPPPDGYLGPRSPFWTDETLAKWQAARLKAGTPPDVATNASEMRKLAAKSLPVGKQVLISALDARLHTGELRFASGLHEAATLKGELADFRRATGAAGRHTFSARSGAHDDLILATALALWLIVSKPPLPLGTAAWGHVLGPYGPARSNNQGTET
jgi:hypothetical protein